MTEKPVDTVLAYILTNAKTLSPEKIAALAKVMEVAKDINEVSHEPNAIPEDENHPDITEEQPIDFADIQGIEVDGKKINTKIYKA